MALKTYIPGAILVLKAVRHYLTKWNTELHHNLTAEQYACISSTLTAVIDCLNLLGVSS